MNAVRKHQRSAYRENGNRVAHLELPTPNIGLSPMQESLLVRETPHAVLGEWLSHQTSRQQGTHAFRLPPFYGAELQEGIWTPPVNVRESDDEMIVEAYIPGLNKSDIQVEIKNGSTLVIKGERRPQKVELEQGGYLRKEFSFRSFFRSFALPLEINPENAVSQYRDGILEVCLKKKQEAKQCTYRVSTVG